MRALLALALLAAPLAAQSSVTTGRALAPGGAVRLVIPHGRVQLTTWDRDSVAIRGRLDTSAGTLTLEGSRDSLRVGLARPATARGVGQADLEITVPREARVTFTGLSAEFDCEAGGGEVTATTTSGRLRVTGTARVSVLETLDGNVELAVQGRTARLRTATGTIVARGLVEELDASSVSGPLLIGMEGAVRSARLESTSAAISFKGDLRPDGRLVVETHGGDVDLRLRPSLEATWAIANWGGVLENTLLPPAQVTRGAHKGEWAFVTGRGGARVEVRTFKGTVRLEPRPQER